VPDHCRLPASVSAPRQRRERVGAGGRWQRCRRSRIEGPRARHPDTTPHPCRMSYASRTLPLPTTLSTPTLIPGTRALTEGAAARDGRFSPDRPLQRSPDAGMCRAEIVRNTRGTIELLEGVTDKNTSSITRKLNHRHTSWPMHDPWLLIASSNKARKRASYKCSCFCSPCGAWGSRAHAYLGGY